KPPRTITFEATVLSAGATNERTICPDGGFGPCQVGKPAPNARNPNEPADVWPRPYRQDPSRGNHW
ncbi:MAG TPA: hypothetical protein VD772_12005, partial [Anseongella sp.]|nr:hypothetical protein [Anseongella sp.]